MVVGETLHALFRKTLLPGKTHDPIDGLVPSFAAWIATFCLANPVLMVHFHIFMLKLQFVFLVQSTHFRFFLILNQPFLAKAPCFKRFKRHVFTPKQPRPPPCRSRVQVRKDPQFQWCLGGDAFGDGVHNVHAGWMTSYKHSYWYIINIILWIYDS